MKLLEIYESIHGELPHLGAPCTVIRFAGCNLKCSYCDAPTDGVPFEVELEDLIERVNEFGNHHILITGGEPTIAQGVKTLLGALSNAGYFITLETNGTIKLDLGYVGPCESVVMDVKLFRTDFAVEEYNLQHLSDTDAIKFVYEDEHQFEVARTFLFSNIHRISEGCMIIFSPVDVKEPLLPRFLELSKSFPDHDFRMQCQVHKILGVG